MRATPSPRPRLQPTGAYAPTACRRRCLWLVAAAMAVSVAGAAETPGRPQIHRLVRIYDWAGGFPWSFASGLEQDARGFLWVTTTSGLYRFDGARAKRFGAAAPIAEGGTRAGRIVVWSDSGPAFEVTAEGRTSLDDGSETATGRTQSMAVASDGKVWRIRDGEVARLDAGRGWTTVTLPKAAGEALRYVHPGRNGRVFVTSPSEVWVVEPDASSRSLAAISHAGVVVERADGSVVVGATHFQGSSVTRIFEVRGGVSRLIYEEPGTRFIDIAERGDALWVVTDRALQALGPDSRPRYRLEPPAIPATGHLIVDREGSLWMATSHGLVQIPEPDAYAVTPVDGGVTRDIARTSDGAWGTFWGKLAFFPDEPGGPRPHDSGESHFSTFCRDDAGRIWTNGPQGRVRALGPGGALGPLLAERWSPASCGEGNGRRRWIVSEDAGLWKVGPEDDRPHRVPLDAGLGREISSAAEAADGTLWLAAGPRMCAAPGEDVLKGAPVTWRCEDVPGATLVLDVQPMPSGDVWALTAWPGTVRRRAGGRWEVVPGSERIKVNWLNALTPSPAGGVWILGMGALLRVAERLDAPEGWEILEEPTIWNGLVSINVMALAEDADGALWLGTDLGLQKIVPGLRSRRPAPPAVEIVEGSANGIPLLPSPEIDLPHRSRFDVRCAAMTYRDPGVVRYRMRLRSDDAWSAPSPDGHFTFVDLPGGRYDLQVAATLDGARWSEPPAILRLRVNTPWYAKPWLIAVTGLAAAAAGHLGFRWRARRRLAIERQRTRIAMDLHDEVGSGLGTITVLAGMAARAELSEERRGDAAARIVAVSQELARSLGDIVWSLRTSSGSLDALWNQLLERARPLFASGSPRVSFEAPDPVPGESLSLVVRRNLYLVVYEALHNAARHAGASLVVLRLTGEGASWRLEVEDDGRGLREAAAGPSVRRGLGIEAMKARVAEMGATIAWERGPAGGTRVSVRFRTGEG